jgi:tight adherence protein C
MTPNTLLTIAVALLASSLLLVAGALLRQAARQARHQVLVDRIVSSREQTAIADPAPVQPRNWSDRLAAIGSNWVDTPLGRQFVAEEDRHLLDQCGVNDNRGKALFFLARTLLASALPLAGWLLFARISGLPVIVIVFFGFAVGYMLPKWVMRRVAAQRRRKAADELPLLLDLLRLLQGVGLSVDQSLHVIAAEFKNVLPILGAELDIAGAQYRTGRSREQSLRRLATVFDNEDMAALARLLVQVEQHGGAVQEPLTRFSERMREQRKLDLKERIGKLTVRMTGVMVLTLLPALLTITGGVGFIAIIRALSRMGGNG